MRIAGLPERLRGAPGPAEPLGELPTVEWSAPIAAKAGVRIPEREMDATVRWELNETEAEDTEDPDPVPTARHRRAF